MNGHRSVFRQVEWSRVIGMKKSQHRPTAAAKASNKTKEDCKLALTWHACVGAVARARSIPRKAFPGHGRLFAASDEGDAIIGVVFVGRARASLVGFVGDAGARAVAGAAGV